MRLTNSKREEVIHKIVSDKFNKRVEKVEAEISARVEKKLLKQEPLCSDPKVLELLDLGWVSSSNRVYLGKGSKYVNSKLFRMRNNLPCKYTESFFVLEDLGPIIERALQRKDQVLKEKADFKKELSQALNACNTYKQVVERIPELAEHFKEVGYSQSKAIVPVELFTKVRTMLKAKK
jgi:hypothetical protein